MLTPFEIAAYILAIVCDAGANAKGTTRFVLPVPPPSFADVPAFIAWARNPGLAPAPDTPLSDAVQALMRVDADLMQYTAQSPVHMETALIAFAHCHTRYFPGVIQAPIPAPPFEIDAEIMGSIADLAGDSWQRAPGPMPTQAPATCPLTARALALQARVSADFAYPLAQAALAGVTTACGITDYAPELLRPYGPTPDQYAALHYARLDWASDLIEMTIDSCEFYKWPVSPVALLECWLAESPGHAPLFIRALADVIHRGEYAHTDMHGGQLLKLAIPPDVAAMFYRAFVVFIIDDIGDGDLRPVA